MSDAADTRLLIVEDEAPIREGLIELFEAQGYEVAWAADGHTALDALAAGGHDLVLLDVMMPGPNGFEVLEQTRARGDDVPVLLLTARGAEDDVVRGLEAGADDYVTTRSRSRRWPSALPTSACSATSSSTPAAPCASPTRRRAPPRATRGPSVCWLASTTTSSGTCGR